MKTFWAKRVCDLNHGREATGLEVNRPRVMQEDLDVA